MADTGVRIDELNPELLPTLEHVLAAMKDGVTTQYSVQQIADLILAVVRDGAPEALDTLKEIADFAAAITAVTDSHETRLDGHDTEIATHETRLDGHDTALDGKQPLDAMLTALAALASTNGKFLAFSGADAPVLRSILGTVSQAAGVPTGALLEYGSNANGSYLRFADGTQVCWALTAGAVATSSGPEGSLYYSSATVFTYPASWASQPLVVPFAQKSGITGSNLCWATHLNSSPGMTTASLSVTSSSVGGSAKLGYIAIGRWF